MEADLAGAAEPEVEVEAEDKGAMADREGCQDLATAY